MTSSTTTGAPIYFLGTITGGRTYLYTRLPVFRSGLEAADYARGKAHLQGYVFEQRQLTRRGINFGSTLEVVATVR